MLTVIFFFANYATGMFHYNFCSLALSWFFNILIVACIVGAMVDRKLSQTLQPHEMVSKGNWSAQLIFRTVLWTEKKVVLKVLFSVFISRQGDIEADICCAALLNINVQIPPKFRERSEFTTFSPSAYSRFISISNCQLGTRQQISWKCVGETTSV